MGAISRIAARLSILAPLAGSDERLHARVYEQHAFNPRSPCGERPSLPRNGMTSASFQSSLPLRGATAIYCDIVAGKQQDLDLCAF